VKLRSGGPFDADLVDRQCVRFRAADLQNVSANNDRNPTYNVDGSEFQIDFRYLRRIDVLATPHAGVIAELRLLGNRRLRCFIPASNVPRLKEMVGFADIGFDFHKVDSVSFR
jgi:hypothetical protein